MTITNLDKEARCALCGEPMPAGEEMFKYHGLSGHCPKPPLPRPKLMSIIEYLYSDRDGKFWLEVHVDRQPYAAIPFNSEEERERAHDDMLSMTRSLGGKDLPNVAQ